MIVEPIHERQAAEIKRLQVALHEAGIVIRDESAEIGRLRKTLQQIADVDGERPATLFCFSPEAAMTELDILRAQVELLREAHVLANEALRSAWEVAEREGKNTNWLGHRAQLRVSLEASHAAMAALTSAQRGDKT